MSESKQVQIDFDTITAEEVIAAYRETGMEPNSGAFVHARWDDPSCLTGCAIGVIAYQQGIDLRHDAEDESLPIPTLPPPLPLPLPKDWLSFALGFDRGIHNLCPVAHVENRNQHLRGFYIGQAVNQWWKEEVENERD